MQAGKQRFTALMALALMLAPYAPAQQPTAGQPKDDPQETFKVSVNVVNILFNAKDKKGALLPDLKREDFEIYEDGVKQQVKYFSSDTKLPLTLGLMIDASGSQQRVLPMEQEVGAQFLREVIKEKDLAFLISFDVNVELLQDFTASTKDLRLALEKVKINTGGGFGGGGIPGIGQGPVANNNPRGTLLYDAIYLAASEKLANEVGRKALIILTDGADYGSKTKAAEAIEHAQKSDAICYVLLIADREFYGGGYGGDRDMKKLAEETGGRMVEVGSDYDRLKGAFEQISAELRSQYSIGYTPTNSNKDGTFRKVEIRAKNAKIQARKGYYAVK